jgi:hypothetical protein
VNTYVPLSHWFQVWGQHLLAGQPINDADRTSLVCKLLNNPPGLAGVQVEVASLVQAGQYASGQVTDVVGQGPVAASGCQSALSRIVWMETASPARPKFITAIAGFPSSEIASVSTQ